MCDRQTSSLISITAADNQISRGRIFDMSVFSLNNQRTTIVTCHCSLLCSKAWLVPLRLPESGEDEEGAEGGMLRFTSAPVADCRPPVAALPPTCRTPTSAQTLVVHYIHSTTSAYSHFDPGTSILPHVILSPPNQRLQNRWSYVLSIYLQLCNFHILSSFPSSLLFLSILLSSRSSTRVLLFSI